MKDGSASNNDYEDLSQYEDEDEAMVTLPLSSQKTDCQMSGSEAGW